MNSLITFISNPIVFSILVIWETVWKGLGLWNSGIRKQKIWFIFMLVFNTVGILPIIYLAFFKDKKKVKKKK